MYLLTPFVIVQMFGALILVLVYFYLYLQYRERYMGIWAFSWLINSLRFIFDLSILTGNELAVMRIGYQISCLLSGFLFMWGTYTFVGKTMSRFWIYGSLLGVIWIIIGVIFNLSYFLLTLPIFTFHSIIFIWTGREFLNSKEIHGVGKHLTGWVFVLWGLHKENYPFLQSFAWFAPWRYIISTILEMSVAIGILLVYFQKTRKDLSKSEERLAVTLRSIGDGVITTDMESKIVMINRVAEKLTGWSQEEAAGESLTNVFRIIDEETGRRCADPVERVLKTKEIYSLSNHTMLLDREGSPRAISFSSAPIFYSNGRIIGVVLVFSDITEQQKMEREILKANKLESISILAGGIAHDFNNILTAVIGNISMAKMYAHGIDEISKILLEAEKAALRAKCLTHQLLTFAKGGAPIKKTTSIAELIKESTSFSLRGSNVKCEYFIPEDLWPVDIDEGQMSQVINNLVINAKQAMPEGGKIRIYCENVLVDPKYHPSIKVGCYVKISICDEGTGIPTEFHQKIFDPYFTTKKKGSGLGLAISYSIIKKHNGYINVVSEVGVGTKIYIYLPASRRKIISKEEERVSFTGKGKILVMDDEELVRKVVGKMLRHMGYEVDLAREGAEAVELYQRAFELGQPFDLVIMDLTVPGGIGGREAIKKLIAIDPQIKAVVSSGYSNDPVMADFKNYGFSGVVLKPFTVAELNKILHQLLLDISKEQ